MRHRLASGRAFSLRWRKGGACLAVALTVAALTGAGGIRAQEAADPPAGGPAVMGQPAADQPVMDPPVPDPSVTDIGDPPSADTGAVTEDAVPRAVGRISYGMLFKPGAAICTGTLIAPDIVLTAGHCVKDGSARTVRFAAGVDAGRAVTIAQGDAILRPQGEQTGQGGQAGIAQDVALLRLIHPIDAGLVTPLALLPRRENQLRLISYRGDAPGQRADRPCATILKVGSVLGLSCEAVSGNSGGPLLQAGPDGTPQVVAVMVARNKNPGFPRSYAVEVPPDLLVRAGQPDQWRTDP